MKKIFTIIAVALTMFAATANAQLSFGVKGGLNLTSMSIDVPLTDNLNTENQAGFFVGPTVKFQLPIVGLGVDASALYNQTQTKLDQTTIKNQSIAVPVNVRFSPIPLVPVFVFAGPQLDLAIGDKDLSIEGAKQQLKNFNYKDTNLSVNVGLGAQLSKFQLTVNYNIGCGNTGEFDVKKALDEGADIVLGKAKTNTWQVSLGYYF